MIRKSKEMIKCDCCGKNIHEFIEFHAAATNRMIKICKKCAIKDGLYEQPSDTEVLDEIPLLTPQEIFEKLNQQVIGQTQAKKALSVELFNHVLRLKSADKLKAMGKRIRKQNLLLTGPTGCGKTELALAVSEILNLPMVICTASNFTEHGYSGMDIESMLSSLLEKCDNNIKLAEKGIIFIDEVDKLAQRDLGNLSKDVNSVGVQKSLLRLIESDTCQVPQNGRVHPDQKGIQMDTTNILFICGGAFSGIEAIVENRLRKSEKATSTSTIGFAAINTKRKEYSETELRATIMPDDLIEYGMLREFVGRFAISNLEPLTLSDMVEILKLQGGILDEYKAYFQLLDKTLNIQNSAFEHIARVAIENGTGARGLRNIMKKLLEEQMFYAPTDESTTKYTITSKSVEKLYTSSFNQIA